MLPNISKEEIREEINEKIEVVSKKVDELKEKIEGIDVNFDAIKEKLDGINIDFDVIKDKARNIKFEAAGEKLKAFADKYVAKAKEILNDEEKVESFLQGCEDLLTVLPVVGELASEIPTIVSMLRAYYKKSYTDISNASLIWLTAGMLYFLAPIDVLPDFVPGLGKVDDVAVLALILKKAEPDIEKYREWQKNNNLR